VFKKGGKVLDWSKTKTVFIAVFLMLNLFLLIEYYTIQNENKLEIAKEASIEEMFKGEQIEYGKLPTKLKSLSKLSGNLYKFTHEDIKTLEEVAVVQIIPTKIDAFLIKPYQLTEVSKGENYKDFLKSIVFKGENYIFSSFSNEKKEIVFKQAFDGAILYENTGAQIIAKLNNEDQIVSFEQTMLGEVSRFGKKEKIIPALKALENLYSNGELYSKSKVTLVELGYFTLFQTTYQILEPTWHIEINNEKSYYVTAFEGEIHQPTSQSIIGE
jgi:regulatory protein YycI of two-component signal transduction system YycFG